MRSRDIYLIVSDLSKNLNYRNLLENLTSSIHLYVTTFFTDFF